MVKGSVIIDDRWKRYTAELEQQAVRALREAAIVTATTGRSKPSTLGYKIADIKSDITIHPPVRIPLRGWVQDVEWKDWRAHMFEKGTYQKLGRVASSRSREGGGGNRGVKPQWFMRTARRAGRTALLLSLARLLR